jgi:hypothetical protein
MQAQAAAAPQAVIEVPAPSGPMRPLTNREIDAIRDRRSDISNQLTSAMNRRENLTEELSDAPPSAQPGILSQIQLLDSRIIAIERDMEASGQMLRTGLTVDNGTTLVAPSQGRFIDNLSQEAQIAMGVSFSVFFLLPIAIGFMRLMARRARRGQAAPSSPQQDQRMERLEQAVDAIALEIERVGESQRYQQKVLAEANMMPAMSTAHRVPDYESLRSRER